MTPRIFIVTNDLPRAALEFSCHPGNLPGWMAVLDSLDDWMKIPSGAKYMALWYGSAADVEGWRNAWATRREKRDLIALTGDELGVIMDWAEANRWAPSMALLYGQDGEAGFTSPLVGSEPTGEAGQIDEVDLRRGGLSATPREGGLEPPLGEGCSPPPHPSPTAAMASASPLPAFVSSPTGGEVKPAATARRSSPSRDVALGPSPPRIDPPDRSAPSAMSRASKWT